MLRAATVCREEGLTVPPTQKVGLRKILVDLSHCEERDPGNISSWSRETALLHTRC